MKSHTFITMLLKCLAEQDEQLRAQEQIIAEFQQEMDEMLAICGAKELQALELDD